MQGAGLLDASPHSGCRPRPRRGYGREFGLLDFASGAYGSGSGSRSGTSQASKPSGKPNVKCEPECPVTAKGMDPGWGNEEWGIETLYSLAGCVPCPVVPVGGVPMMVGE